MPVKNTLPINCQMRRLSSNCDIAHLFVARYFLHYE